MLIDKRFEFVFLLENISYIEILYFSEKSNSHRRPTVELFINRIKVSLEIVR